jgi:vacuolar protein sorting-associated protein IST1
MAPVVNAPMRLKISLKTAVSKLKFIQEKKTALAKQQRRQLADLLKQGKESSATIRVENIIRDDIYVELLELIELYCELLLARISVVMDPARPTCEESLLEAAQSVVYAAPHTELKEISVIREILVQRFGPEFGRAAAANADGHVPPKIVSRCQWEPPSPSLVRLYLCEIARTYNAPYSHLEAGDDAEPGAGPVLAETGHAEPGLVDSVLAEEGRADPSGSGAGAGAGAAAADFDALKARFAALKGGK